MADDNSLFKLCEELLRNQREMLHMQRRLLTAAPELLQALGDERVRLRVKHNRQQKQACFQTSSHGKSKRKRKGETR